MRMSDIPVGEVSEGSRMKKKLENERKRIEDFIDTIEYELNNKSWEERLDKTDDLYFHGQISACEDFLEFLNEVLKEKGEKNGNEL